MGNEATKQQIKDFLQRAVENAQKPNEKERLKKLRLLKAPKIAKKYGLTL